ncbi:MAG: hypothetical protein NC344_09930 [Bacteroidales bacterium]|nr:hypothetical protein [Bacteroidales bacterium]MCM1148123.1 hypothetical protein [Bacteroidales bacterium]MCM1206539.1 hypothetical protein [Bacillota bacterium]MCM1510559.1 hypothetical protein [Clostridium sp.]
MKNIIFIIIIITFYGCGKTSKKDRDDNVAFPVIALLSRVDCTWFEDSTLNKKSGIDKMGKVFLKFILTNPNDSPVALPIYRADIDTLYKSHIEVYRNKFKLESEKLYSNELVLRGREQCSITVKIQDISETGYRDFKDISKAVSSLDFRYIKDVSDSIYFKERLGCMKFYIDNILEITYRSPDTFDSVVMYR